MFSAGAQTASFSGIAGHGPSSADRAPGILHGQLSRFEKVGFIKGWKQRYLGQRGAFITVYTSEYEQGPDHSLETIDIRDIEKVEPLAPKHKNAFEIHYSSKKESTWIQADNSETYVRWMAGLSDWQSFLRKNPTWGGASDETAQDEAFEQAIISLMTPEDLAKIRADLDARVQSKLNSLNGLERLVGFYGADPYAQQKAQSEVESKRRDIEKLQEVQRRIHRYQSGDKDPVIRDELRIVEDRLKKQLSGFDGVEKLAAIYPAGSTQAQSVQQQLRILSEGIAVLEQSKQKLALLAKEGAANEVWAEAVYDFVPEGETELELKMGDAIRVTEKTNAEWWTGECRGKIGLFPSAYVTEKPRPAAPAPAPVPTPVAAPTPIPAATPAAPAKKTARALYDFEAASDVELHLYAGDIITLQECEPGAEWWRGVLTDGRDGMFPSSYVELIETPQPVAVVQQPPTPQPQPKPIAVVQQPPQPQPKPAAVVQQPPQPQPKPQQPIQPQPKPQQPPQPQPKPVAQPPTPFAKPALPTPKPPAGQPRRQIPTRSLPPAPLNEQPQPPMPVATAKPPPPTPQPKPQPQATPISSMPTPAPITADVLYPFDAENPGEISVPAGEVCEVVDTSHADWTIIRYNGQVGAVPSNYVRVNSPLAGFAAQQPPQQQYQPPQPAFVPPAVSAPAPPREQTAVSNYSFTPEADNELGLQPGDVITLTSCEAGAEWWAGSLPDGRAGVFPSSYVTLQQ